jgi:hypothetical protein
MLIVKIGLKAKKIIKGALLKENSLVAPPEWNFDTFDVFALFLLLR